MTPDDDMVFYGKPPLWHIGCDDVHISVTFSWDIDKALRLADNWVAAGYGVTVGGPAWGLWPTYGEFTPGLYTKTGCVITSRGCNNKCWFCHVWKREGPIRELEIKDGWNILDSNLLQCSESHIRAVFDMLKRQVEQPIFSGGLEAASLEDWHVDLLTKAKPQRVYFAYDLPEDYEPLVIAAKKMWKAGFRKASHKICCYVLIGYPKDTFRAAETRLEQVIDLGLTPFAMLYHDDNGGKRKGWGQFQRLWTRPTIIYSREKVTN